MKVLISCSKTKKSDPESNLVWTEGVTTSSWLKSIEDPKIPRFHPKELYSGRSTSQQIRILESFNLDIWFVSAGMGVLDGKEDDCKIPSYEASFSSGSGGPSETQWSEMHSSSVAELGKGENTLLLIPAPYLRVLEPSLTPFARKMITFDRGSSLVKYGAMVIDLHPRIREVIGCAASDYWTEVLKLVLPGGVASKKLKEVNRKANQLPERELRTRVSDLELLQIINSLPDSVSSAQKAVRYVRDVKNIAAQDKRIFSCWKMRERETITRSKKI